MEENINIQAEFEQLIEQLERLKNINELASANTESSREVISNVGTFIKATDNYSKSIELNLNQKSVEIDKMIVNLEKSILKIESETKIFSTNVGTSFNGFKSETQSSFNGILLELKITLEGLTQEIDKFIIEITDITSENTIKIIQNEKSVYSDLSSTITKNDKILNETLQKHLTVIEQSKQKIIENENNQIQLFTEHIKNNNQILIQKIDNQNEKIGSIKTILYIICGLIILGTILAVRF